jgi:hypothetical protein
MALTLSHHDVSCVAPLKVSDRLSLITHGVVATAYMTAPGVTRLQWAKTRATGAGGGGGGGGRHLPSVLSQPLVTAAT